MKRRALLDRLLTLLAVVALFATGLLGSGFVGVASAHTTTAHLASSMAVPQVSSPDGDPLLLVHGFQDTCEYAFNRTDQVPNTGLNAITTVQYLTQHGWSSSALDDIGYYDPSYTFTVHLYDKSTATTSDGNGFCTHNLQTMSDQGAAQLCSPLLNGYSSGTPYDSIEHLGCLLAWYIYDTYGGRPVDILAHSMGGLIVRDAIGESGHTTANSYRFPPSQLNVHVVVTVGTPHGGVWGQYMDLAQQAFGTPQELLDMDPTSPFMSLLNTPNLRKPQGLFGTYWALMASSIPCNTSFQSQASAYASCQAEGDDQERNNLYPDGDGVVQADSALAMPADFKILYGAGNKCPSSTAWCGNPPNDVRYDGGGLEYAHEANSCADTRIFLVGYQCFGFPFYLNDGSTGSTQGWICNVACTSGAPGGGGIADMGVVVSGKGTFGQSVLHSLAEIVALLTSQGPGTTGGHKIAVGQNSDGRLELFARRSDGTIRHNWQNSSTSGWSGWAPLSGSSVAPAMLGEPAVGRNSDGRLEVFARAIDGTLWHIWQNNSPSVWSNWAQLGPSTFLSTSDPIVGQNSDGSLEVFARGTDGGIWTIQQSSTPSGWGGWLVLGGQITSDPAIGRNSDGRLEVFARATDGSVWHTWQVNPNGVGGWTSCCSLGGQIVGDPTVGQNSDGRLEVFARATDGSVWHTWQVNPNGVGGWTSCCSLGGQIIGDPAVGQNSDGRLEVFALTPGGALQHNWQNGTAGTGWSGWATLGKPSSGPLTNDPAIGRNSDGRLEVFMRGVDGTVWHIWQNVSTSGWSSWAWMGSL